MPFLGGTLAAALAFRVGSGAVQLCSRRAASPGSPGAARGGGGLRRAEPGKGSWEGAVSTLQPPREAVK